MRQCNCIQRKVWFTCIL